MRKVEERKLKLDLEAQKTKVASQSIASTIKDKLLGLSGPSLNKDNFEEIAYTTNSELDMKNIPNIAQSSGKNAKLKVKAPRILKVS